MHPLVFVRTPKCVWVGDELCTGEEAVLSGFCIEIGTLFPTWVSTGVLAVAEEGDVVAVVLSEFDEFAETASMTTRKNPPTIQYIFRMCLMPRQG